MAEHAVGGHLLTGVGGDDVFGNWPWHDVASVIAGRTRASIRDARRLLHVAAPVSVRAEIKRRREPLMLPWIVATERARLADVGRRARKCPVALVRADGVVGRLAALAHDRRLHGCTGP